MDNSKTYTTVNPKVESLNMINIQKMVFIYNALLSGWTVKYLGLDRFEFLKSKSEIKRHELNLKDYLKKFVDSNLNIENIKK